MKLITVDDIFCWLCAFLDDT